MTESVHIFERYLTGDDDAAAELFHRYLARLTRLARSRLSAKLARRVDAEDIVMSAYRSFFVGARGGEFAVSRSGDLWALLARITLNKLYRTADRHTAAIRNPDREQPLSDGLANAEPRPEEAVAITDELATIMAGLEPRDRRLLELALQGESQSRIAAELRINERTVRRAMTKIREGLLRAAGLPDDFPEPKRRPARTPDTTSRRRGTLAHSDFVLEKQIGLGGMGRVYRSRRKSDSALFALKYLRKAFVRNAAAVDRFVTEAETVERLQHPNIVRVHGFGASPGGAFFIAMDLADGGNLRQQCLNRRPAPREIVDWLLPVCDALVHVHDHGIVHCDLKPENILLSGNGVLLTDFGLARQIDDRGHEGEFAGTAPFMAPEQVDPSFGPVGPQTDLYGLGAVLFALATGQPPVIGHRSANIFAQTVSADRPRPSTVQPVAEVFDSVCAQCLARRPAERFASVDALAAALRACR